MRFDSLYKRDSKGKVREWYMEIKEGSDDVDAFHRTVSGIKDGAMVESTWKRAKPKNVGRSNATTAVEQAKSEVQSHYDKKLEGEYFRSLKEIDSFTMFKPMLAVKYEKKLVDFESNKVYVQPKLDGIRCIARKDGLWTRQFKPITSCPHIVEALVPVFEEFPDLVVDGELYNHSLRDDFNKITSLVRKTKPKPEDVVECARLVQYHIYDAVDGQNPNELFMDRYSKARRSSAAAYPLHSVPTVLVENFDWVDELYSAWLEHGYEGQMVRIDMPYENKRSKTLLKRKEFISEEFDVVDVLEGEGNWSGHIKRFEFKTTDGKPFRAGVRGTQDVLKKMFDDKYKPDWATVRYFTPTPDGIPRFPVVTDWGKGKRED